MCFCCVMVVLPTFHELPKVGLFVCVNTLYVVVEVCAPVASWWCCPTFNEMGLHVCVKRGVRLTGCVLAHMCPSCSRRIHHGDCTALSTLHIRYLRQRPPYPSPDLQQPLCVASAGRHAIGPHPAMSTRCPSPPP